MARRLLLSAQGLVGRAAALGGATLLACGPPSIAGCVANPASYAFEKAELLKIVDLSGIPVAGMTDFERCGVSTITRYCSFGSGKLVTEPPDNATIRTLMAQLRASSPLGGTADEWPDPTGSDDDKTEYAALATKFMALGRYVAQLRETALRRELESIGIAPASAAGAASTKPSREEEEKKNHRQRAADLTKMAAALYSIDFGDPCDSALLVETSHAFGRNRLAVAHLKSGKYGRPSVHVVEKPHYTAGDDGTLKVPERGRTPGDERLTDPERKRSRANLQRDGVPGDRWHRTDRREPGALRRGMRGRAPRHGGREASELRHDDEAEGGQGVHAPVGGVGPEGARSPLRGHVHPHARRPDG